jgi:hypothetical protein
MFYTGGKFYANEKIFLLNLGAGKKEQRRLSGREKAISVF